MKQDFHDLQNFQKNFHINIGSGNEINILDLAHAIKDTIGFKGVIIHDNTKPDGTPRKIMNSQKLNTLGWKPKTSIKQGIQLAYSDFKKIVKL
jgi:GDP-L-fucose synthase